MATTEPVALILLAEDGDDVPLFIVSSSHGTGHDQAIPQNLSARTYARFRRLRIGRCIFDGCDGATKVWAARRG